MQDIPSLIALSDADLRTAIARSAAAERAATADLIALLAEYDRRRLYLGDGYSSLFQFCVAGLHLSESATYTRIQAARAARKWPAVLEALRDGSVTLTAIGSLAPHFTDANCTALLAEARHQPKSAVERIVARLVPKPDVTSLVRKLPAKAASVTHARTHDIDASKTYAPLMPSPRTAPLSESPVAPLAPERYKLQVTIDEETRDLLRQAQDLMRHTLPSGDPAIVVARALRVLVDDLLKRKTAATTRPRCSREAADGSRAIPQGSSAPCGKETTGDAHSKARAVAAGRVARSSITT